MPEVSEDVRTNAAVLFLDLQAEIMKNSRTQPVATLVSHAGALAQLAALHGLPAFASSVPPGGDYLPEVLQPLDILPRPRTQTSAFVDRGIVAELKAGGRSVLVLAGVASEIVVVRTALDALHAGYTVHVAVDACGGVNPRTEDAAWRRISQAGGVLTSVTTFGAELTGDFTTEIGGENARHRVSNARRIAMAALSPAQALIAAMLTPALLILAAGSLIATALVRLARIVDRIRGLSVLAVRAEPEELELHARRARLSLTAVTCYFVAVALFVSAGLGIAVDAWSHGAVTWLPVTLTLAGMLLIVFGAAAMTVESRYSAALILVEISRLRKS